MKTVYSAANISLVSIFQNMLEEQGIKCWIKNEALLTGIGEIPPIETWPQLCVEDDDFLEAKRIVDEALATKDINRAWKCDSCGEVIEGQFAQCWNCGTDRPESDSDAEVHLSKGFFKSLKEHPDLSERERRKQIKSMRMLRMFLLGMSALIFLLAYLPLKPDESDMRNSLLSFAILLLLVLILTYLPKRTKNQ
jgi:hypothetical protein